MTPAQEARSSSLCPWPRAGGDSSSEPMQSWAGSHRSHTQPSRARPVILGPRRPPQASRHSMTLAPHHGKLTRGQGHLAFFFCLFVLITLLCLWSKIRPLDLAPDYCCSGGRQGCVKSAQGTASSEHAAPSLGPNSGPWPPAPHCAGAWGGGCVPQLRVGRYWRPLIRGAPAPRPPPRA